MIDFSKIQQYRENNRIEAKKALGGLPQSIWETYSAFANTLGGIILLGVVEDPDHSLHPVDLPDPERLIQEFWQIVNNPKKVSVNILTRKHVQIEHVDGNRIIVITVPRAQRYDKPVYIDGNPLTGSYRRSGEGDYRCTREEVRGMLRDAAVRTPDMRVLEKMGLEALDWESIHHYRARMQRCHPNHAWEQLEDVPFLYKLGAAGKGSDGAMHPTAAGLLMFGFEYEIVKEFPNFFLDYQEQLLEDDGRTDRIVSSSGDWSGNLYDFYFRVCGKITQRLNLPSSNGNGGDEASVRSALCEALANSLINADYHGRQGVVVIRKKDLVTFSNPGGFRIEIEAAKTGGVSDPRNAALTKMFYLVNIGERAGSGIPNIYSVWTRQGWLPPTIEERFSPERITLSLPLRKACGNQSAIKISGKKATIGMMKKQLIIEYLTDHASAKASEISEYIGLKPSRARDYLKSLIQDEIVVIDGSGKNRTYKLKA